MSPDQEPDLTRKQRREQARSERKATEQAAAARAEERRKRLIQLGGVVGVVAVIIVAILLATGGSGGSKKPVITPVSLQANQAVAAVTTLLDGIPQKGNVLGNPNAPVTLQYFGDLECPICKEFTLGALPTVVEKYVRAGKLKIEYRSLETASREPSTFKKQQVAALAAGKQDKMWDYLELFYHEQGEEDTPYVTESYLQGLAQQVPGLNLGQWTSDRGNGALAEQLETDSKTAEQEGLSGTPAFLLGKTGGTLKTFKPESTTDTSAYESAINQLL